LPPLAAPAIGRQARSGRAEQGPADKGGTAGRTAPPGADLAHETPRPADPRHGRPAGGRVEKGKSADGTTALSNHVNAGTGYEKPLTVSRRPRGLLIRRTPPGSNLSVETGLRIESETVALHSFRSGNS